MVREFRDFTNGGVNGEIVGGFGGVCVVLWVILVTVSALSVMIFSCADGVPKEKSSSADSNYHGGGCAAGCGARCGAGCGA